MAQEAISQEEPTPSSVDEMVTPMKRSFEEKRWRPGLFPWLKEKLKDTPAFFRDTKLDFKFRTYYFEQDNTGAGTKEAWAIGGALSYQSGWFLDHFALGAVGYTSQPLSAPRSEDGTLLLGPGQEGYTVLGQIYGRVKLIEDNFLNIYPVRIQHALSQRRRQPHDAEHLRGVYLHGNLWRERGGSGIAVRHGLYR